MIEPDDRRLGDSDRRLLDDVEEAVAKLNVDRSHGPKALKKPLLLLLVISRIEQEGQTENRIPFASIEDGLGKLIRRYGGRPTSSGPYPEQPFYFMQSDKTDRLGHFWHLHLPEGEAMPHGKPPRMTVMRRSYATLDDRIFALLSRSREARARLAYFILDQWFPETWHEELKCQLGLPDLATIPNRRSARHDRRRSAQFVDEVLENFRHRCAFCGFHSLLDRTPFGLDAAHVKWFSSGGPDTPDNGLALCKLHHWAFDGGAMSIDGESMRILVSKKFCAQDEASRAWIESVAERPIEPPKHFPLNPEFIRWHQENTFFG